MPSASSASFSSTKTLIQTLFLPHIRRAARALASAKSFLVEIFRKGSSSPVRYLFIYFTRNKRNNKIYLGSFRLHYNWCSSRYWSVPPSVLQDCAAIPSLATSQEPWRCSSSAWRLCEDGGGDCHHHEPSGLSGYLRWLEEKRGDSGEQPRKNEIDQLADAFIAKCHEKFILEKQESDRRFHEMLARSM